MKKTVLAIMLAAVSLAACDDSTSSIGYDVIPKDDEITAVDSVFHISTQTVQVDKVLANTSILLFWVVSLIQRRVYKRPRVF